MGDGQYTFTPGSASSGGSVTLAGGQLVAFGGSVQGTHRNTRFQMAGTFAGAFRAQNCDIALSANVNCTSRWDMDGCEMRLQGRSLDVASTMTNYNVPGGRQGRLLLGGGTLTSAGYTGDGTDVGPGTINGGVRKAPGGAMQPGGMGGIGTLTINGDLTLDAGASIDFAISAQGASGLVVNGNASLAGTITASLLGG